MATTDAGDRTLRAWSALVDVYQGVLHEVVRALERDAGMDSGVFSALAYLERAEPAGTMRLGRLADLLHPRYSQPGLSRLVQRMEADGLVTRRPDPTDRRATILVVTRRGEAQHRKADRVYRAAVQRGLGRHLTGAEARDLLQILGRVAAGRGEGGR